MNADIDMYGENVVIVGYTATTALNPLGTVAGFIMEKNVIFETHYAYVIQANVATSKVSFVEYVEVPNYVAIANGATTTTWNSNHIYKF